MLLFFFINSELNTWLWLNNDRNGRRLRYNCSQQQYVTHTLYLTANRCILSLHHAVFTFCSHCLLSQDARSGGESWQVTTGVDRILVTWWLPIVTTEGYSRGFFLRCVSKGIIFSSRYVSYIQLIFLTFVCPFIANIFPNYNQQNATFH